MPKDPITIKLETKEKLRRHTVPMVITLEDSDAEDSDPGQDQDVVYQLTINVKALTFSSPQVSVHGAGCMHGEVYACAHRLL